MTPEQRYAVIADELVGPSVAEARPSRGFGSSALKVDTRIFAMLVQDRLVVKLPRQRVDALIASGEGERFDPGHGRLMREWLTVDPSRADLWLPLATEARAFVSRP